MTTKKRLAKMCAMALTAALMWGMLLPMCAVTGAALTPEEDMTVIKNRIKTYFLTDEQARITTGTTEYTVDHAGEYLASLQSNGSWADVDYLDTTTAANRLIWEPYHALGRMLMMASAYCMPGKPGYQDPAMLAGIEKTLTYWASVRNPDAPSGFVGPWSTNWWENGNGVQQRFMKIGVFLEGKLSSGAMSIITTKLNAEGSGETGQNGLWSHQNAVYRALLEKNTARLTRNVAGLARCLTMQTGAATIEGLQPDNSYWTHGDQYYAHGYGRQLFIDMALWIYLLRDTQFAIPMYVLDNMAFFMLEGTRWTIWGDVLEMQNGYAPPETSDDTRFAEAYLEPLALMAVSDTARAADYLAVRDSIAGTRANNGRSGSKYMWRSQYMARMTDSYGVNVKMDAPWMKGWEFRREWPEGQPKYNLVYWTSSAASNYVVQGHEYDDVYPAFDWAHTPGATAPNTLTTSMSTNNTNPFVAGVSDGHYGVTAYHMNKSNTQARKGYFFFGDEIVALGAGITSGAAQPVHTTLNQSRAATVNVGGTSVPAGTDGAKYAAQWLHNEQIGYVFFENTDVYVSNKNQYGVPSLWSDADQQGAPDVFTAWVDHGVKPANGSYAYIVVPDKSAAETAVYAGSIPVTVVANTGAVQAVRHDGLKLTQINFYQAGSLEYKPGHVITVDKACVVMIDESGAAPLLHVAVGDHTAREDVTVTVRHGSGAAVATVLRSASLPFAGQTMTAREGDNTTVPASSYTGANRPHLVRDGKADTVWQSAPSEDQWIAVLADNEGGGRIQSVTVTWGQQYATHYKVQVSTDGRQWFDIAEVTDGKGGTETVPVGDISHYLRIVCIESVNGSGYEIAEISEDVHDDAIMRFSGIEKEYTLGDNDRLFSQYITADGGARNLTAHDPAYLFLSMNIYLDWDDPAVTQLNAAQITGGLRLRCADYTNPGTSGTEHSVSWNANALGLQKGMNRLYLPLAAVIGGELDATQSKTGIMDWTAVNRLQIYIAGLNRAHPGVFFTMEVSGVRVELLGDFRQELEALVSEAFDADDYYPDSYAAYLLARQEAQRVLDDPDAADYDLRRATTGLQKAIDGLERLGTRLGDVNGDGGIDSTDARMVLQHEVRLIELDAAQQARARVSASNSSVDSSDARLILQYEVKLIDRFPAADE